jgi:hypothetical protein
MPTNATLSVGRGGDSLGSDSSPNSRTIERKKPKPASPEPAPRPSSGHRLIIQQDQATGEWIYTVTDRDTGAVIARISREEVAKLGLKPDYAAGALIKAKA